MALVDVLKGAFTSGELSTLMLARQDVDRYKNGAILLEGFKVLPQGGITRCEGTHFAMQAKYGDRLCLVKAFEPSTTDAYILEVGHQYMRFYKNHLRLDNPPGTPVEVATPYQAADLRLVRTAQSNDVMLLVHPSYAPRRLSRLSDLSWDQRVIPFNPPPLFEAGTQAAITMTLGAVTGTGVSLTASAPYFLRADTDRVISSGIGRGIIRGATSTTMATIDIIDAFASTTLLPNSWTLEGSPVAQLKPDKVGPAGARIALTLQASQPTGTDLVVHGSFDSGLTGWTNQSGGTLASGTHTGALNSATLQDSGADFVAAGLQPTMVVRNTTDGSNGVIAVVTPTSIVVGDPGLVGGGDNDFDTGDAYTVTGTGAASVRDGAALLTGGAAGVGWISQGIPTTIGLPYQATFRVMDTTLSAQVGTTVMASDVLAEASYPIGEQTLTFVAKSTTSYLQFRNNQNNTGRVTGVSVKLFSQEGFRDNVVGKYILINGGLVRITERPSLSQVVGEVVKPLNADTAAAAGAWTLEEPAWSDILGWPSAVVLYEGRLGFAGSSRFPQTLWMSAIDDLFNFFRGPLATDALQLDLVDSGGNITLNRIRWLMPSENLLVGTTHGEYRLVGSGDDPLTPATPPRNRIQSTYGSDTVQPLKVGAAILFAQRQGSKVREMAFDERTATTFTARDITVTSDHLLKDSRVLELAYQQEPLSIVWADRSDGQLLGLTYDLPEQVVAWWRRPTQGAFESVATIPHPTANAHQVWTVARREINGQTVRFIEYFDAEARMTLPTPVTMRNELTQAEETITGWDGLTVDAAKVYTGVNSNTLTGLAHLEGAVVDIVGDGIVFPSQVVSGAQVVLPQVIQDTAFVGLHYTPRGRTMPIDLPIRGTTQQGLKKRWTHLRARLQNTACLVLQGERIPFRQPHMPQNQGVAPFTGDRECLPFGWDRYGFLTFEVDQPLPCTIIGLMGTVDAEVRA